MQKNGTIQDAVQRAIDEGEEPPSRFQRITSCIVLLAILASSLLLVALLLACVVAAWRALL
jgi:hypothetical protein